MVTTYSSSTTKGKSCARRQRATREGKIRINRSTSYTLAKASRLLKSVALRIASFTSTLVEPYSATEQMGTLEATTREAENAFSIAAIRVPRPPTPFGGGSQAIVEDFSSDGPRRVFYERSGTPITP